MIDLMLRFPDEAAAIAALPMLRSEDGWLTASHTHALDVLGCDYPFPALLYPYDPANPHHTPVYDEDGGLVAVKDDRWHANLRLLPGTDPAIAAAAEPFAVNPSDPARVWA